MPNDIYKTISEAEWRKKLTPDEYMVLRQKGTEPPFIGEHVENHRDGTYRCKACGQELFDSETKFESGSGWPSFTDPVNRQHVRIHEDNSHGMSRTEVLCNNCNSHLGHLFDDGPADKGGQRYCINSVCMTFEEKTETK